MKLRTLRDTLKAYAWWGRTELAARVGATRPAGEGSARHVALLAWTFPPMITGGVYRPTALVKYGTRLGWRFSVIAGPIVGEPGAAGEELLRQLPPDLRVERMQAPALRPTYNWFPRIDGGFLNALATFDRAREMFAEDPPDVVLATGPPFHNFAAALFVARCFRAKLVLDYRDEWTECPFPFVELGNSDRWWEARCLRSADGVVFVTQSIAKLHLQAFSDLRESQCHVVPNGWEPNDFGTTGSPDMSGSSDPGNFILTFVGTLGSHSLPAGFLATLADACQRNKRLLEALRIRFVGYKNEDARRQLANFPHQKMLESINHVPQEAAARMMRDSDALLMINEPALARALPGKLFSYLASGTPILLYGEGGEMGTLVSELKAGVIVPANDPFALESVIQRLQNEPPVYESTTAREEWLTQHTREEMAKKYIKELEVLVRG